MIFLTILPINKRLTHKVTGNDFLASMCSLLYVKSKRFL